MIENYSGLDVKQAPFPHLVADGWWPEDQLNTVINEFPDPAHPHWKRFSNSTENKWEGSSSAMLGPETINLLLAMQGMAPLLQKAFDTPPLTCEWIGGGYHWIQPGGYLGMHADFSRSPATGRYRWLNMLVYLNRGWDEEPGGCLQLWDDNGNPTIIRPEFNRTVVFQTSAKSWHGHPAPNVAHRRSVAAYFYAETPAPGYAGDHSTVWHPKVMG